jgi:hypothetical protein
VSDDYVKRIERFLDRHGIDDYAAYANRSLSHTGPVSGTSKRKLKNGEQRLELENHRAKTKASKLQARDSGSDHSAPQFFTRIRLEFQCCDFGAAPLGFVQSSPGSAPRSDCHHKLPYSPGNPAKEYRVDYQPCFNWACSHPF